MKTRFSISGFNLIMNIVFWILVAYFAGDCGMGIYITAFLLYGFLFTVFMGGIMNTVSKMVSVRCYRGLHESAKSVFKHGMLYSFFAGVIICLILLTGGNLIMQMLCGTTLPSSTLKVLAFNFFFQSLIYCLTGYYQGLGNSLTYNLSVVIKNIIMVASAPFVLKVFFSYGKKVGDLLNNSIYASVFGAIGAGVILGVTSFLSLIILLIFHKKNNKNNLTEGKILNRGVDSSKSFLKSFTNLFFKILKGNLFPLTAAVIIIYLYIHIAVKSGLLMETVFINVGVIFGKLFVVCFIPLCLFREYIIKEKMKIHNDFIKDETKNIRIRSGYFIKNSLFILLPITIIAITLAKPIVMIFFGGRMKLGVSMLRIGGILILLAGITMTLKAILTAIQKETAAILISLIALAATIVFSIVMFKKDNNIALIVYSFVLYYLLQVILLALAVYMETRVALIEFRGKFIIMGISGAVLAGAELLLDYFLVMNVFLLALAVLIGYSIYLIIHFIMKGITKKDELALKDSFIYFPIHFIASSLHMWD